MIAFAKLGGSEPQFALELAGEVERAPVAEELRDARDGMAGSQQE